MLDKSTPWAVAVIASRESSSTLVRSIGAVFAACSSKQATVDVLINGNPALAEEMAALLDTGAFADRHGSLRIWSITVGDKAFAWNEYLHRIWPAGTTAFFIDGYAEVRPGAFTALERCLGQRPEALGATGVPTSGRSAAQLREQMLRHGGFHGNMHVLRAETMAELRTAGFRLPKGLYRTDSLIGAMLMFGLDATRHGWRPERIAVEADATWEVPGISALSLQNVKSQLKRMVRQAQGDLENRAVREHLVTLKRPAPDLPDNAQLLVKEWMARNPSELRALFLKRPLCLYAAYKLRAARDWSAAGKMPLLVKTTGTATDSPSGTALSPMSV